MMELVKHALKRLPDGVECVVEENKTYRERRKAKRKMYVCKRVGCRKYVFSNFPADKIHLQCRHPQFQLGNGVKSLIYVFSLGMAKAGPHCSCEVRRKLLNLLVSFALPAWLVRSLQFIRVFPTPEEPWDRPAVLANLERIDEKELNSTGQIR